MKLGGFLEDIKQNPKRVMTGGIPPLIKNVKDGAPSELQTSSESYNVSFSYHMADR
jgi:hypothetical protein